MSVRVHGVQRSTTIRARFERATPTSLGRMRTGIGCAFILALSWRIADVGGELVGALVMPHGGIALDPAHFNTSDPTAKEEAWHLHTACRRVATLAASLKPDLVLLSTPHGIADLTLFQFYLNPRGQGSADTDNCACPPCCYNVSVGLDSNASLALVKWLQSAGARASGMAAFGPPAQEDADPFPLRWGEVIPLHFLTSSLPASTRFMVLSQPSRRYTDSVAMIPELLKLGESIYKHLQAMSERVLVVVSADLAHTHLASGPYGYSNASEPFDLACGLWGRTLNSEAILSGAADLVGRALSCGYTGLVMLHGILYTRGLQEWSPKLYANYHPSYYGMMVASFTPAQGAR